MKDNEFMFLDQFKFIRLTLVIGRFQQSLVRQNWGIKKNELKPWKKIGWVIPPEQNADFVTHIEQGLDVYK